MRTLVNAYKCSNCGTLVYSRARHDFRSCPCGALSVDGGFDYTRILFGQNSVSPKSVKKYIKASKKDLYDDWNHGSDKFGVIRNGIKSRAKSKSKKI